jgi:hypothetical protein
MRRILTASLIALTVLTAVPVRAALPACVSETEKQAMIVRSFQSYLMVAAVACNQAQAYNTFISKNQRMISGEGTALKAYFRRVYGPGEKPLNDFITALANAWSQIHMNDMGTYCRGTWETMWKLDTGKIQMIEQARLTASQPAVAAEMCSGAIVKAF